MAVDLAALTVGTTGRWSTGVLIPFGWESRRWDQLDGVSFTGVLVNLRGGGNWGISRHALDGFPVYPAKHEQLGR